MTEICRNIEKTIVSLPLINGYTEFFRYKIFGDGNCGYHAISVWLKKNRPAQYDAILAVLPNPKPKYPILGYLQDYLNSISFYLLSSKLLIVLLLWPFFFCTQELKRHCEVIAKHLAV